ncbi:glycine C-acetyltransferase [Dorcoceras hygrometricum]|uniref:Glycine C-acetyltransferase n=1 Tax=Dorcoceras hygrometricum TaxID=472368 RepID=A0A2Z7BGT7_9LAMI|nr:glycine C-acetyltransferase [Dorcoceras hygrometricum]
MVRIVFEFYCIDRLPGNFVFRCAGRRDPDPTPLFPNTKNLVYDAKSIFSKSGEPVSTYGKKKLMKYEYRLLNDILAKAITVEADSFDAVTNEHFLMMTAIQFGLKVNWSKILFSVLEGDGRQDTEEGQGEAVPLTIIEPTPATTAEKSPLPKHKSKKRKLVLPRDSDDETVEERQVTVEVADEEPVVKHTDEVDVIIGQVLVETSQMGKDEAEQLEQTFDETNVEEIFFEDTAVDKLTILSSVWMSLTKILLQQRLLTKLRAARIVGTEAPEKAVGRNQKDEELMSIDDLLMQIFDNMMLPSVTAAEVTKIRLGSSIAINEVQDRDWYYASLPRISIHDKGKEPLEEFDIVKGNPAREMVALICGDVEFLLQLRDQFMKDGNDYWRSSCRLSLFVNKQQIPDRATTENLVPHCFFIEPVQYWGAAPSIIHSWGWYSVCTEVVRYNMFGCLRPVRDVNFCRDIVVISSVVDILEKLPTGFCRESIPLKTFEPPTAVPADDEHVEKRVSVEEAVEEQSIDPTVDTIEKETVSTADEVYSVIAQVLAETAQMEETETAEREQHLETGVGEEKIVEGQAVVKADEVEHWFNLSFKEFAARQADRLVESASETDGERETVAYGIGVGEQQLQTFIEPENRIDASTSYFVTEPVEGMELADVIPTVEENISVDEAMTLEEILLTIPGHISLPSAIGEVTKIQLGKSISIPGVDEGDWELLIQKFLEVRKSNFVPNDGSSATDLKVLDWLSDLHLFVLEELKEQMLAHVIALDRSVFRETTNLDSVVQRAPLLLLTDSGTQENSIVHMDIDQRPDSPPTSANSSMCFDEDDTAATQFSLPDISTDLTEAFAQLRASVEQIHFEQIRHKDDADKLRDILLMHIRDLEKQFSGRFDEQDRLTGLCLTIFAKIFTTKRPCCRWMFSHLNRSSVPNELLDFRAKAEDNHLNLSTQLGFLVDYINRGGDAKKGEGGSSSRPQPPPDDQSRPSGGNGSRADDQSM